MAERKIYPMGITRESKQSVLDLVPEEKKEEARKLIRSGEETAVIFAKVSRSNQGFQEIAKSVDEEGASQFHSKWTVSVEGYGHKSVGEHAPLHIAVENVASSDGDDITDNRLGSYTEFSARFKGRQEAGYFTPKSVQEDPRLQSMWDKAHLFLFDANDILVNRGREWVMTKEAREKFPQLHQGYYKDTEGENAWKTRLGKHVSDQFKNLLPASRLTSMGVTWNGTEAEHAIAKLLSSEFLSDREIGEEMKKAALEEAPALVKYAEFNPYKASLEARRLKILGANLRGTISPNRSADIKPTITKVTDPEAAILAAFLFESDLTGTFSQLYKAISRGSKTIKSYMFDYILEKEISWNDPEKGRIKSEGLGDHDMPPRAFEMDGGYIFEMNAMEYGSWRDYKRHRMQSYIAKPLSVEYGYMVPPLAEIMDESEDPKYHGSVALIREAVGGMEEISREVRKVNQVDARYAVTRLHFRPAIARYNMREAFHLLKLRTGDTAHPFVRDLMWGHVDALNELHPNIVKHIKFRGERTEIAFP